MGLFTKYCEVCGRKIEKGKDFVRFGKHFDSEEHAEQYTKNIKIRQQTARDEPSRSLGGCC